MLKYTDIETIHQCEKRFYLELNTPAEGDFSVDNFALHKWKSLKQATKLVFDNSNEGFNCDDKGNSKANHEQAIATLLQSKPLFQAKFSKGGVSVVVNALIPIKGKPLTFKLVEVIASIEPNEAHFERATFNFHVAKHECEPLGITISKVVIASINKDFVYAGDNDYTDLFNLTDITKYCSKAQSKIDALITQAINITGDITNLKEAPQKECGEHCTVPQTCQFLSLCAPNIPQAKAPVSWLPNLSKRSKIWDFMKNNATNEVSDYLRDSSTLEMAEAPDDLLSEKQLRVKQHTLKNKLYFDKKGAKTELSNYPLPLLFLDFETANFAVPLWEGFSPYVQIPFQFSLHKLDENGLEHFEFLDLSGDNPTLYCSNELIRLCKGNAPIFAHNASFEKSVIKRLAEFYPKIAKELMSIEERIVDLLPIAREYYYHPAQKGSWSIKALLPTIAPDLDYNALTGVQNGGMAMSAYAECLDEATTDERKEDIRAELLAYCKLDTLALVYLWGYLSGNAKILEKL
jgi:Domain of unknown function(DUF2779)